MSNTPVDNLVKTHKAHGWETQSTDHIRNVSLVESHSLMLCPCGWHGWIKKTVLERHNNA